MTQRESDEKAAVDELIQQNILEAETCCSKCLDSSRSNAVRNAIKIGFFGGIHYHIKNPSEYVKALELVAEYAQIDINWSDEQGYLRRCSEKTREALSELEKLKGGRDET